MQSRSLNFPTKTGYQNIESIEHIDYISKLKFPSPLPNWQLREALHKRNGHLITIMMTIVLMMTMMTMKMMTMMIMGCWVCWHWGNDSLTLSTLRAITPHSELYIGVSSCCNVLHCVALSTLRAITPHCSTYVLRCVPMYYICVALSALLAITPSLHCTFTHWALCTDKQLPEPGCTYYPLHIVLHYSLSTAVQCTANHWNTLLGIKSCLSQKVLKYTLPHKLRCAIVTLHDIVLHWIT